MGRGETSWGAENPGRSGGTLDVSLRWRENPSQAISEIPGVFNLSFILEDKDCHGLSPWFQEEEFPRF
jgi:hypothetical protein